MKSLVLALLFAFALPVFTEARSKNYCDTCERNSHGHIKRDPKQTKVFRKQNPCPGTGKTTGECKDYVIDHVIPLKRGGPDHPSNMQWQTKEEARAKDKWE